MSVSDWRSVARGVHREMRAVLVGLEQEQKRQLEPQGTDNCEGYRQL